MAKKTYKMTKVEIFDTFIPIFAVSWVLVFGYISLFNESGVLALFTVMPVFFLYSLYLIGSAVYCFKEVEILEAMGLNTEEAKRRNRAKAPKLNKTKLAVAGGCFVAGILLCIFL